MCIKMILQRKEYGYDCRRKSRRIKPRLYSVCRCPVISLKCVLFDSRIFKLAVMVLMFQQMGFGKSDFLKLCNTMMELKSN